MNVFDLAAKITLDDKEYNSKLDGAFGKLQSVGSKIGSGLATAAKVGAAAVGAAATAVGTLAAKSVSAYAEYEQMVGGVKKLYGNMGMSLEDYAKSQGKTTDEVKTQWETLGKAQDMVLKNAQNAYKTAGMSANQYMATATSFSAALINSLNGDTVKAAEATDVAMTAIADNWNTFGGDIGMIQNAFQGFAKKNYMMLDNLKLGYGGTKTEMERLIKDANEYAKSIGQASDLSINSFADIVTAIDLVQQKQQIAGTTAREASTTIQGSLGMVKAAWENLMVGMADGNADLDKMMGNLVDSITGYTDETGQRVNGLIDNILPVAEKALASVSTMIEKLAPMIGNELPKLVNTVLPSLLTAGTDIVGALVQGIADAAPTLLNVGLNVVKTIMRGILEGSNKDTNTTMSTLFKRIISVLEAHLPNVINMGKQFLSNMMQGMIQKLPDIIKFTADLMVRFADAIISDLPAIIQTAAQIILALAQGLSQALPELIPKMVEVVLTLVGSLIDNIDLLVEAAIALMTGLAQGLIAALPILIEKAPEIIIKLVEALISAVPTIISALLDIGSQIVQALLNGFNQAFPGASAAISSSINNLVEYFAPIVESVSEYLNALWDLWSTIFDKIKAYISSWIQEHQTSINMFVSTIKLYFQNGLLYLTTAFQTTIANIQTIVTTALDVISNLIKAFTALVKGDWDSMFTHLKNAAQAGWNGVKQIFNNFKEWVSSFFKGLIGNFKQWGNEMLQGLIQGIEEKIAELKEKIAAIKAAVQDAMTGAKDAIAGGQKNKKTGNTSGGSSSGGATFSESNGLFTASMSSSAIQSESVNAINNPIIVNVVLEGDADRLFRVMQAKARTEYEVTGNPAFA